MLTAWKLARFKSIKKETTLDLAPLTVFTGANSSGKSTVIQSILLTAQTLQSPVAARPIVLNGHIARLGAFPDLVSDADETSDITIGFRLNVSPELGAFSRPSALRRGPIRYYGYPRTNETPFQASCEFKFSARGAGGVQELRRLQPLLESTSVTVATVEAESDSAEIHLKRTSRALVEKLNDLKIDATAPIAPALATSLEFEVTKIRGATERYAKPPLYAKQVGASMMHFLPGSITVAYDTVEAEVQDVVNALTSGGRFSETIQKREYGGKTNPHIERIIREELHTLQQKESISARDALYFDRFNQDANETALFRLLSMASPTLRGQLAERLSARRQELEDTVRAGRAPKQELKLFPLPDLLTIGVDTLQQYFSYSLFYLGPLRDDPKPIYPLAGGTDPTDVGFRGEHTAAVLDINRNTPIRYVPSMAFEEGREFSGMIESTLLAAVLDWLKYMGVGSNVRTSDRGKLGHELKVSTEDARSLHDITQVGVGVSQLLPILVLSLLAQPGSTLVFEQPELHLHPRVQTRLADFFVSLTQQQKQCIVETHSEYLINRLRYRAAVSPGREISDSVALYFVEKNAGESSYRRIHINEFGVIPDWPVGFFDENESNAAAILEAGLAKRANRNISRGS
jgi:predicted ATPase